MEMVRVKEMKKSAGIRRPGEGRAQLYGPGTNIEVPRDLAESLNLEIVEGEETAEEGNGGDRRAELEKLTKDKLVDKAAKLGLTVTRGDGEEGDPLKEDYINAIAAAEGK